VAKRKKNRQTLAHDPFGPWVRCPIPPGLMTGKTVPDSVFRNRLYQVLVYRSYVKASERWPEMHWLSIKRLDRRTIHDWRDMQRIKNEMIGMSHEAVEVYPAESRLLDTSNQYHLWVFADPELQLPFGFPTRAVVEAHDDRSRQREWAPGQTPPDAMSLAQYNAMLDDVMGKGVAHAPMDKPPYRTREEACTECGATLDPHVCGICTIDGKDARIPLYTGVVLKQGLTEADTTDQG